MIQASLMFVSCTDHYPAISVVRRIKYAEHDIHASARISMADQCDSVSSTPLTSARSRKDECNVYVCTCVCGFEIFYVSAYTIMSKSVA